MATFLEVPSLHATAQHVAMVQSKIDTLLRAKDDGWDQLLTATSRLYAAGELSIFDLVELLDEMREQYGTGFTRVWDRTMPVRAKEVKWEANRVRKALAMAGTSAWHGPLPLDSSAVPPDGVAVVYVLFDAANVPVYVGSTASFKQRMSAHRREKPEAVRWSAYRCRDRQHAYEMEDRALKEHRPRMNQKAGR